MNFPLHAWQKVSGCFVAKQAYQYLTLGNFFDDAHTKIAPIPSVPSYKQVGAYYLIDDVLVTEAGVSQLLPATAFNSDTTLCAGRTLNLALPNRPEVRYHWQDGSTAPTFTVGQPGTYAVSVSAGLCSRADTLRVRAEVPLVVQPPDTTLCRGEVLTLTARHPAGHYLWSDTSTDSTLTVRESGSYTVQVPNRSCLVADTVRVRFLDCPGVVPNVFTPNDDGRNDTFAIENMELLPWKLLVYNRWGGLVCQTERYQNDWRASGLPAGTYFYQLTNQELGRTLKGWVQVLR
ncbi:MAG: gliding motility-associated C-terminal domain-containing protein [Cytophagaceae bacterium]|nr:gliding motility-associated C-terminal domain-containing protein [Cytophagaceae bacterium]